MKSESTVSQTSLLLALLGLFVCESSKKNDHDDLQKRSILFYSVLFYTVVEPYADAVPNRATAPVRLSLWLPRLSSSISRSIRLS